ncbi:MAG: hypothetical protein ACREBU_17410 [Nitrososphaera sp.]
MLYGQLVKPFRSRYSDDGSALERDVRDALDQILSGLPYILKVKSPVVDRRGNAFNIDLQVLDGKSYKRYAIIECKNIHSRNPYTNEIELVKGARPLLFFKDDRALKICVVNKRRKLSDASAKKIDHLFRYQVRGRLYDWSEDLDWLKMTYGVRKMILKSHKWKESLEFCGKLLSYAENELDIPKRKRRKLLKDLGIRNAHGMVYAYDVMKKKR